MTVKVRLFAILKQRAGRDHVEVELPERATVADALALLAGLPGLEVLERMSVRMAVNRDYATAETVLGADDELALIPPVSGGAADVPRRSAGVEFGSTETVVDGPLSLDALLKAVADPAAGGVVTFQGLPRDVPALDYEAYAEMAAERIAAIVADCIAKHGLCRAAAQHRTGTVPALEPSIIVAASAPHRGEAFAGAREILDRIKAEAPIWKVEVAEDGTRTPVEGTLPP